MSSVHKLEALLTGKSDQRLVVQDINNRASPSSLTAYLQTNVLPKLEGIFPFVLMGDDVEVNEDGVLMYQLPTDEQAERAYNFLAPLPHDRVWLETTVRIPEADGKCQLIWIMWNAEDGSLFRAIPLVLQGNIVKLAGVEQTFDPTRGPDQCLALDDVYGNRFSEALADEYCTQIEFLCYVLDMLNTKRVAEEQVESPAKLNKSRSKKGRPPIRGYTQLRFLRGTDSQGMDSDDEGKSKASPRAHWRRSHLRTLPNGKQIVIKRQIVGLKPGEDAPLPQTYVVPTLPVDEVGHP